MAHRQFIIYKRNVAHNNTFVSVWLVSVMVAVCVETTIEVRFFQHN